MLIASAVGNKCTFYILETFGGMLEGAVNIRRPILFHNFRAKLPLHDTFFSRSRDIRYVGETDPLFSERIRERSPV